MCSALSWVRRRARAGSESVELERLRCAWGRHSSRGLCVRGAKHADAQPRGAKGHTQRARLCVKEMLSFKQMLVLSGMVSLI